MWLPRVGDTVLVGTVFADARAGWLAVILASAMGGAGGYLALAAAWVGGNFALLAVVVHGVGIGGCGDGNWWETRGPGSRTACLRYARARGYVDCAVTPSRWLAVVLVFGLAAAPGVAVSRTCVVLVASVVLRLVSGGGRLAVGSLGTLFVVLGGFGDGVGGGWLGWAASCVGAANGVVAFAAAGSAGRRRGGSWWLAVGAPAMYGIAAGRTSVSRTLPALLAVDEVDARGPLCAGRRCRFAVGQ